MLGERLAVWKRRRSGEGTPVDTDLRSVLSVSIGRAPSGNSLFRHRHRRECCVRARGAAGVGRPRATRRWTAQRISSNWARRRRPKQDDRLLIGIDCAFALPARDWLNVRYWARAYSRRRVSGRHIDRVPATACRTISIGGDVCRPSAPCRHAFLATAVRDRPSALREHHRATEHGLSRDAGLGAHRKARSSWSGRARSAKAASPECGSCMRLRQRHWAIGSPSGRSNQSKRRRIVCVELYPRLFMRMAGHGNAKVQDIGCP